MYSWKISCKNYLFIIQFLSKFEAIYLVIVTPTPLYCAFLGIYVI